MPFYTNAHTQMKKGTNRKEQEKNAEPKNRRRKNRNEDKPKENRTEKEKEGSYCHHLLIHTALCTLPILR